VWLNIYDVKHNLQLVNDVAKRVGTGVFHAGVEVYGQEWSFGFNPTGSGVYGATPMRSDQHKYRESVPMGRTSLAPNEVGHLIKELRKAWTGTDYEILSRNCCHFANKLCISLGVGLVPEWVVNLSGAGVSLVEGVDQAVVRAHAAAELARSKAVELDEHYQITERISGKVDSLLSQDIEVDEVYIQEAVHGWLSRAKTQLDNVGTIAGQVLQDVMTPAPVTVPGYAPIPTHDIQIPDYSGTPAQNFQSARNISDKWVDLSADGRAVPDGAYITHLQNDSAGIQCYVETGSNSPPEERQDIVLEIALPQANYKDTAAMSSNSTESPPRTESTSVGSVDKDDEFASNEFPSAIGLKSHADHSTQSTSLERVHVDNTEV
jgi:hypothetical protein